MKIKSYIILFVMFPLISFAQSHIQYTVKQGDTMASIAAQYGITEQDLKRENAENAEILFPGLLLNIPQANIIEEALPPEISNNGKDDMILLNDSSYIMCKVDKVLKDVVMIYQNGCEEAIRFSTKEIVSINYANGTIKKFNNNISRRRKRK